MGQGKLYRIYDELLRDRGVTSAQVLLTFFDMSARTHYLNARQTLTTLLAWRVLPVINENDTTATDEISFGDNDFLAAAGRGARRRRRARRTGAAAKRTPRGDDRHIAVVCVQKLDRLGEGQPGAVVPDPCRALGDDPVAVGEGRQRDMQKSSGRRLGSGAC